MRQNISSALWAAILILAFTLVPTSVKAQDAKDVVSKAEYEELKKTNESLSKALSESKTECENSRRNQNKMGDSIRGLHQRLTQLANKLSSNSTDNATIKKHANKIRELRDSIKNLKKECSAKGDAETTEILQDEKPAQQVAPIERSTDNVQVVALSGESLLMVGIFLLLAALIWQVLPQRQKKEAQPELSEIKRERVLTGWQESGSLEQLMREVLANSTINVEQLKQLQAETNRIAEKIDNIENKPPTKSQVLREDAPDAQAFYRYAEAITDTNVFYRESETKKNASKFIIEIAAQGDVTARFDLNRDSPQCINWLKDTAQYLQYGCNFDGGSPRNPSRAETIEKGIAILKDGQWRVQTPLRLRLS